MRPFRGSGPKALCHILDNSKKELQWYRCNKSLHNHLHLSLRHSRPKFCNISQLEKMWKVIMWKDTSGDFFYLNQHSFFEMLYRCWYFKLGLLFNCSHPNLNWYKTIQHFYLQSSYHCCFSYNVMHIIKLMLSSLITSQQPFVVGNSFIFCAYKKGYMF